MTRKILVVTGSRAEFGLLQFLMKEIEKEETLELQIIVTGSHLSREHGFTVDEIKEKGFSANLEIDLNLDNDTSDSISNSIGIGIKEFTKAYRILSPDIIVVLGDRYEILSAAISALISKLPLAHIHGGEVTEGAFDEAIRHSVTKMSHLHFVANDIYKKRVIQLGELPQNVYTVGGLGVDALKKTTILVKEDLEKSLGCAFLDKNLLITIHPVTLNEIDSTEELKELLKALDEFKEKRLIFTLPNADPGNQSIRKLIGEFVMRHPNARSYESLGSQKYLSCLAYVDGVVGNSSSGISEAPSFKIATVNIGDRQKGRLMANSIINCNFKKNEIKRSIEKIYSSKFQSQLKNTINPYGEGGATEKIVKILKTVELKGLIKKPFYDLGS
jgi:GDP/UDP-N,N'-diacetylbacillosamine 2-epimerase (hydrolysing)